MVDEYVNEPRDPAKVRFLCLEQQIMDINCNINLLMEALSNKFWILENMGVRMQRKNQKEGREIGTTRRTSRRNNPENINLVRVS